MTKNDKRVKYACYAANFSMSVVSNITPVLFLTFKRLYGVSFTELGFLVLINFTTQLVIDLLLSVFSHKINMHAAAKSIPIMTFVGLLVYAGAPIIFPGKVYTGLVIGSLIFAASGAFVEVLISPIIAALPSENPDREVSALHSIYAWGTVAVVILSTLFLYAFGQNFWQWLVLIYTVIPVISAALYFSSALPILETPERISGVLSTFKNPALWVCFFAIFLGGASECAMAQWSSSYLEAAIGIPKALGDILGVAAFSLALGFGRTLYSRKGKSVEGVLLLGGIAATVLYMTAALAPHPALGLIACALTGLATSMLWPGGVLVGASRVSGTVLVYGMMAAGGDLGASLSSQLIGVITDKLAISSWATELAPTLGMSAEQLSMRAAVLISAAFPLLATFFYIYIFRTRKR